MDIKRKGEEALIGDFKQLIVKLIWTSAVDLDLMAFYRMEDGRVGGVYSTNYDGGSLGSLNAFPFMQLSGDAGVGATGGDNEEVLRIVKLDGVAELFVVAINFTDAAGKTNKPFANYDARVEVQTDKGEKHTVRLDSREPGPVSILCHFSTNFMGAKLTNDSKVFIFEAFQQEVPAASQIKLESKVRLTGAGQGTTIKPKVSASEVLINLNWNTGAQQGRGLLGALAHTLGGRAGDGIDLDLGCLYELRNGHKGSIQPLGEAFGDFHDRPFILHEGDDRTGQAAAGENMRINLRHWSEIKRILIYTYIYEGVAAWEKTDAIITIRVPGSPDIEVPMGHLTDTRTLCALVLLENEDGQNVKVTRKMTFHTNQSTADSAYGWGMRWQAGRKD